jgi:hypothetical protein
MRFRLVLPASAALCACSGPALSPPKPIAHEAASEVPSTLSPPPALVTTPATPPPLIPQQIDPDGNDDPEDPGAGTVPSSAHFERVGIPPLSLERICDLTPFQGALYAAHANQPLGTDGATVTRYEPVDAPPDAGVAAVKRSPFRVAFDWNRPGEPTNGGGAGQGFLRVHAIDGRLFVPDADPPYDGFGISERGTEGYVFISDALGKFAKPLGDHFRPPAVPTPDGGAGAAVLPRAYHVLDVIRFRGRLYASTGSVPPTEHAWRGPSPGALHVANAKWSRFTYEVDYPFPWQHGVWRLGFMTRFKDRLYAGIQDYDGREPNDYVVFAPPPDSAAITHEDVHPHRVTTGGASQTLRWYTDHGRLYWISMSRTGEGALRVSDDGEVWRDIRLPEDAGRPTDITRFRDALVVLTERGLFRVEGEEENLVSIAKITEKKSPFTLSDFFCAAPIAVFRNELYAGGQRGGAVFRVVAE